MLSDEEMAKIDQLRTDFKYKGYGIGSGFGDSARLRKKSVEGVARVGSCWPSLQHNEHRFWITMNDDEHSWVAVRLVFMFLVSSSSRILLTSTVS